MAKETIVRITDDIDGSEAVESIRFGLRGVEYEIDLNAKNVAAIEKAFEKWIQNGHKAETSTSRARQRRSTVTNRDQTAAVREWAKANGYRVSDRGRISAEVREAYNASS
ncbi:MAG: Lsr2 family protein [Actinomycetota bacterium]|nr:Lsr2 family protein [Actinomycetota bacterium]